VFHFLDQSPSIDIQHFGRSRLIPARVHQRLEDDLPFALVHHRPQRISLARSRIPRCGTGADLHGQVTGPDERVILPEHEPFHRVAHLAHVAGPCILDQQAPSLFRVAFDLLAVVMTEDGPEMLEQQAHILHAILQGRDVQGKYVQAVKQVLPETPGGDLVAQAHVGRRDD
jgi:hypothetical protein